MTTRRDATTKVVERASLDPSDCKGHFAADSAQGIAVRSVDSVGSFAGRSNDLRQKLTSRWDKESDLRTVRLLECARNLALMLRERYGNLRIVLIGSVASGRTYPNSDIDLYVEGLPEAELCYATGMLQSAADVPVDLLTGGERAAKWLKDAVQRGVAI